MNTVGIIKYNPFIFIVASLILNLRRKIVYSQKIFLVNFKKLRKTQT